MQADVLPSGMRPARLTTAEALRIDLESAATVLEGVGYGALAARLRTGAGRVENGAKDPVRVGIEAVLDTVRALHTAAREADSRTVEVHENALRQLSHALTHAHSLVVCADGEDVSCAFRFGAHTLYGTREAVAAAEDAARIKAEPTYTLTRLQLRALAAQTIGARDERPYPGLDRIVDDFLHGESR